jgi:UDP-N-acetylmuramate dehydrogenase
MDATSITNSLSQANQAPVLQNHPMAPECTFALGGSAQWFCMPPTTARLKDVILAAQAVGIKWTILGGGSNTIVRDEGYPGLIISTKKINHLEILPTEKLRVGAGVSNKVVTQLTLDKSLAGFEWASGLPGSVGGGVYMNAKCYGHAFSDIVDRVRILTISGESKELDHAACHFAYKDSIFQHEPWIITEVTLTLTPGTLSDIRSRTEQNQNDRDQKGQFTYPSAGCVFKNNYQVGVSSGHLIEELGLKGKQEGGVQIYDKHANFIVNTNNGKTTDVINLMQLIQQQLHNTKGIDLEPEVRIIP